MKRIERFVVKQYVSGFRNAHVDIYDATSVKSND